MTTEPPKRRWFQFRLRTLLIVVLVLSLPLSWFGARLRKARRQRETVEEIRQAGSTAHYDWERMGGMKPSHSRLHSFLGDDFFEKVVRVDLDGTHVFVTDTMLKHLDLRRLPYLQDLRFWNTQVTDGGLQHLEDLTGLRSLHLCGTQITDVGMEFLNGLPHLEHIDLHGTQVTDAGLGHLEGVTSIEHLDVSSTHITDVGLSHLERLVSLEHLILDGVLPASVHESF